MSIRTKCFLIQGVMLTMMGAVAFIGVGGIDDGAAGFERYRATAEVTAASSILESSVMGMRMAMKDYLIEDSEDARKKFLDAQRLALKNLAQVRNVATADAHLSRVAKIERLLARYGDAFSRVAALQNDRRRVEHDILETCGKEMESAFDAIVSDAYRKGNHAPAYYAGQCARELLSATKSVSDFLTDRQTHFVDSAAQALVRARQMLSKLESNLAAADLPQLAKAKSALEKWDAGKKQLFTVVLEVEAIVHDELDAIGPQVAQSLGAIRSDIKTQQQAIGVDVLAGNESRSSYVMLIGLISFIVGIASIAIMQLTVVRPLNGAVKALELISDGESDLNVRLPETGDTELRRLAKAFNTFVSGLSTEMSKIAGLNQKLSALMSRMDALGNEMSNAAEATSQRAHTAGERTTEVDLSMQSVSAAVEQMSASIAEIANHSASSQDLTHQVAAMANEANDQIQRLGSSSSEIGEVVKVITTIADQTNLLALNATIEAARAGESGKGFAVVANEVKELAQGTAGATEDIHRRVATIQTETRAAMGVIEKIAKIVGQVTEAASTIAAAVQEQSATSTEISQSVNCAAAGTNTILGEMQEVSAAAGTSSRCRDELLSATGQISTATGEMRKIIDRYRR